MSDKGSNIKVKCLKEFALTVTCIILVAFVLSHFTLRLDLTEDKRYTLSKPTKEVLKKIKNDVYIQVYLDGEMPIPLKRLKRSIKEILYEFRIASGKKIDYIFINPADTKDAEQRDSYYMSLYNKGLNPINVHVNDKEGEKRQKLLFPGMLVNYNGMEMPVNILKNSWMMSYEQNIQHSIEAVEYELAQTISTMTADTVYKIAFLEGHGELSEIEVADITMQLGKYFTVDRGKIGGQQGLIDDYAAMIVAGPVKEFDEADKFILDQYIMKGGKIIWLVEEVKVPLDTLAKGETFAVYCPVNLEDQLFKYGARVNPEIVKDIECQVIRLAVSSSPEQRQMISVPWVYNPLLMPSNDHPITRNINRVKGEFVNYIDTVGLNPAIRKTILLTTSANVKTVKPPQMIRLKEAEELPDESVYNKSNLPVAVLLEGVFPSAFKNRMVSAIIGGSNVGMKTESVETKMIVIADRDIIRNDIHQSGNTLSPYPLGQDKYTGELFGNRDFLVNCLNYLVDDNGLMELRSREVKMRLLDKSKIKAHRLRWQLINIFGPVIFIIGIGLLYNVIRKKRFSSRACSKV